MALCPCTSSLTSHFTNLWNGGNDNTTFTTGGARAVDNMLLKLEFEVNVRWPGNSCRLEIYSSIRQIFAF